MGAAWQATQPAQAPPFSSSLLKASQGNLASASTFRVCGAWLFMADWRMRSQYRHGLRLCLPSWQLCLCVLFSLGVASLARAPLLRDTLCPTHGVAAWVKLRAAGVWGGASPWSLPARSSIMPSLLKWVLPKWPRAFRASSFYGLSRPRKRSAASAAGARTRPTQCPAPSIPPGICCKAKRSATPGRAGGGQL